MRDKIQSEFDRRFGIRAYEIYGATEGNCILGKMKFKKKLKQKANMYFLLLLLYN